MVSIVDTNADGGQLSTEHPHSIELGVYIELPVSSMSNSARSACAARVPLYTNYFVM